MFKYFVNILIVAPAILYAQPDTLEQKIRETEGLEKAERISDAVYFYSRSNPEKAALYVKQSIDFAAENKGSHNIEAFSLLNKGVWLTFQGLQDSAIYYLDSARNKKPDNTQLMIKILTALGKSHITDANAEKGLVNLFDALGLLKQSPNPVHEMKIHSNIMWAYLELKRYTDCIRYGRTLLRAERNRKTEWIIPYLTNNIAASYGALNNLDSARYFVELGIPIAEANHDNGLIANGYFILGNLYANQGQYKIALQQFEKASPYREKTGNVFYQVSDLYVLAELYYKTGAYQQGIAAGLKGLQLAEANKLTQKFEGVYQALAMNYEALGDYKNAARYYKLLASAKDSVYTKATAEALAEMETRYETEKKELLLADQQLKLQQNNRLIVFLIIVLMLISIIVFIWRKQALLKLNEREVRREKEMQEQLTRSVIASQEAERARFAKDLHDGMGQFISSVRLLINASGEAWVGQANELLDAMHREIRDLAFSLLPYTLTTEGLSAVLQELAMRISRTGKIAIHVSSPPDLVRMPTNMEVAIYRVAQEWINNVIKYAEANQIHISIIQEATEISVLIEDNGLGFNPEILETGSGHGWKNIRSRIQACEGRVSIESSPGAKGSVLMVIVPASRTVQLKVA